VTSAGRTALPRRALSTLLVPFIAAQAGASFAPNEEPEWSFTLTPYAWLLGFDGKARIPGLPEIEMKSSFKEILEDLDVGGMVAFEGRRGKGGFVADLLYSRLTDSGVVPPGVPAEGRVTTFTGLLAALAQIHKDERATVDGLLGFRYWSLDAKATTPVAPIGLSKTTRWIDPQIGVKATGILDSKWRWHGSFLVAPKDTPSVDLSASVSFATGANSALRFGYRHLTVRRLGAASGADASLSGPLVGLSFQF
jgi:hypothetical protein